MKLSKQDQVWNSAVRYHVDGPSDKPSGIAISIAYENAPVPEHYYVADYYQIVEQDLEALLIFGKMDHPATDKIRNKVEVYFPAHMFVGQLWKSSREFQKTLQDFVEKNKASATRPSSVSAATDKVQTLHANNVLMVMSAGQCIMDFFYISAKELWLRPPKGEPINIEALVRIITSPALLLGFLQECDVVAKRIIERLGPEVLAEAPEEVGKHADLESH